MNIEQRTAINEQFCRCVHRAQVCQNGSQFRMCPQCDNCRDWYLNETCSYVTMARVFDSHGTVIFAVFISLWGARGPHPVPPRPGPNQLFVYLDSTLFLDSRLFTF